MWPMRFLTGPEARGVSRAELRGEGRAISRGNEACPVSPATPNAHLTDGSGADFKPAGGDDVTIAVVNWGSFVNSANIGIVEGLAVGLAQSALTSAVEYSGDLVNSIQEPYMSWLQAEYGVPLFSGVADLLTINPVLCNTTAACSLTDAQIQTELARQVSLGALETGSALLYVLNFPPNVSIAGPSGAGNSCQQFCAYHWTTQINGTNLPYVILPDYQNTACGGGGCGQWPGWQGNMSGALSHELMETLTDPVPFSGWTSNVPNCTEIGDLCNAEQAQVTNNGYTTVLQKMWSNNLGACVISENAPEISNVNPASGSNTIQTFVTVQGRGFQTSGMTFQFGDVGAATGVSCTATQCTMFAPPLVVGGRALAHRRRHRDQRAGVLEAPRSRARPTSTYDCVPAACTGGECGTFSNACGGTMVCGCPSGDTCYEGTCCAPETAATACGGATCGTAPDGCGGTVTCGPACPCLTEAQACAGLACGTASNGCGTNYTCGTCKNGLVCEDGACVFGGIHGGGGGCHPINTCM